MSKKLKITQKRSYIGRPTAQRKVLKGMGLGKMNKSVYLDDTPEIRGMVAKVIHLVSVEELEGDKI
ncbi:MAG: 50S ribosomal protein L30 [Deltaproteobacteria bacterium]|nr:50S ribosomal protein L30 [Deltaproteobacteria bacterium]